MNQTSYENLIEELCSSDPLALTEAAFQLSNADLSYKNLTELMSSDSQSLKHLGLLKLTELKSKEDTNILVSCLTGNDSRIRELTSFRIKSFIQNEDYQKFFQCKYCLDTFCNGIMDVNPQVCRNISFALNFVEDKSYVAHHFISIISETITKIKTHKPHNDRKYTRLVFALYWNLEALISIYKSDANLTIDDKLINILEQTASFHEYTIREQSAELILFLSKTNLDERYKETLERLKTNLSNDENFYVRKSVRNYD